MHFHLWDFINHPIDFLLTPTPDVGADIWIKLRDAEENVIAVIPLDDVQIELKAKWEDRLVYRTLATFISNQYSQILHISNILKNFAEIRSRVIDLESKNYILDQEMLDRVRHKSQP